MLLALFAYALPLLEPPFISTPDTDFGGVLFTVTIYCWSRSGSTSWSATPACSTSGYVGFYAIGAYTAAILTSFHANWPLLLALPIAVVATMISGVLLGAPTLRVRGDYLAIVTLGFGEIIRLMAHQHRVARRAPGASPNIARPPSLDALRDPAPDWDDGAPLLDLNDTTTFLEFGVLDQIPYYWLGLTVVIIVLFADTLIKDSRVGRAWEATREDEDAAELMGVPTFRFKLLAFAMGAFIGGSPGALYASRRASSTRCRSCCCSRSCSSPRSSSAVRATAGACSSVRPRRLPAGAVPWLRGLAGPGLRGRADAPGDLPAAGPAAAETHGPGQAARAGDRGARGGASTSEETARA